MGKSYDEVERVRKRLSEYYVESERNIGRYAIGTGICFVRDCDPNADASILEELCIHFYIRRGIKPPFEIPKEGEGVRIYKAECDDVRVLEEDEARKI